MQPFNLRALIEQKIRDNVPAFKEVAGAADLLNIMQGRKAAPGCYIFPERTTAGANTLINKVSQRIVHQHGVVVVVRNVRSALGADAADECYDLCSAVGDTLLGWAPITTAEAFEYAGGALVAFKDGFYIWRDSYRTAQLMRS